MRSLGLFFGGTVAALLVGAGGLGAGCGGTDGDLFGTTKSSGAGAGGSGGRGGTGGSVDTGGQGGSGGQPCVPKPEVCGDGLDNDCDGDVDEGCVCVPGSTQVCYSGDPRNQGVGSCLQGTQSCGADGTWGGCIGEVLPSREVCDGKDNDCDGMVDEGLPAQTCGVGACMTMVPGCTNGSIPTCTPLPASAETCDGIDNDCNGVVDDGNPGGSIACNTGKQGPCSLGVTACASGAIVCNQLVQPSAETCDGIDNDCSGGVDNGNPGGGMLCSTGLPGGCAPGLTSCANGMIVCNQTVPASVEKCDGVDNDCDGVVDDGNPGGNLPCNTGLLGVCAAGTTACESGSIVRIQKVLASAETCDGLDNDCDGTVDEGNPGSGVPCNTGLLGVCAAGITTCSSGAMVCTQSVQASADTCDGLDNDCDGTVDDGNPGGGAACSTGLLGVCATGTMTCANGVLSCVQNQPASPELCDSLDNNCNGQADEGNPGGGVPCGCGGSTVCNSGVPSCQPGAQTLYFWESFANNSKGWTLGPTWAIGATQASAGQSYGSPDPAMDHTVGVDNGVAGVVLGGNAPIAVSNGFAYLTSPVINTGAIPTPLHLTYWRWLNSDCVPWMTNVVQVFNGATWMTVYQSVGCPGVADAGWTKQTFDVTAHKNSSMRIRFGYSVDSVGSHLVSGWNVDEVFLSNAPCP